MAISSGLSGQHSATHEEKQAANRSGSILFITVRSGSGRRRPRFCFGLGSAVGRTSPSFHAMRKPAKNSSIGSASVETKVNTKGAIGYLDELLLCRPHVAQQANRIEGGVQRTVRRQYAGHLDCRAAAANRSPNQLAGWKASIST
jgi:hypothetical protein